MIHKKYNINDSPARKKPCKSAIYILLTSRYRYIDHSMHQ